MKILKKVGSVLLSILIWSIILPQSILGFISGWIIKWFLIGYNLVDVSEIENRINGGNSNKEKSEN